LSNSNISSICPRNMINLGALAAEIGWRVWGTPANFNGFRVLTSITASTSLNEDQPNFTRCLAIFCAGTLYIKYILKFIVPWCQVQKFFLRLSLAFSYIGGVTARHSSSGRQPNFAAWYKECNYGTRHFQQTAPPIF